jgi:MFS family permease
MLSGFAIWGVFEATFVLFLLDLFGPATRLAGTPLGTRSVAGLMLAAILVVGFLLGSPLVGRWSDRPDRRLPLALASLALTVAGLLGLTLATTAEAVTLAVLAVGLAVACGTAPLAALVSDAAAPGARAATMAAYSTLNDVANSAGSIAGAWLATGVGYRPTYLLTAVVVAAATPLVARPRRKEAPA